MPLAPATDRISCTNWLAIQAVFVGSLGGPKFTPMWSQIAPVLRMPLQHQRQVRRHLRGQHVPAVAHGEIDRCIAARPDGFSDRDARAIRVGTGLGFGCGPIARGATRSTA